MRRMFSFLAGALCGALVGAVLALLLTPASGENLRSGAKARWEEAMEEAQRAREETKVRLNAQFEQMKQR
ncbi:MAG: YtxH domain-containing protein [Anaerolineales bacterium]|nr:YtxH domain-containing protein [Anaerolineales bacterium]MCA9931263.1 YtxH domain-containing protein [Anaerolineales bacterium]